MTAQDLKAYFGDNLPDLSRDAQRKARDAQHNPERRMQDKLAPYNRAEARRAWRGGVR